MTQHISKDVLIDVLSDILSDPVSVDELIQSINSKADASDLETLQTSLSTLQTTVSNLQTSVNNIQNSKVNKTGDTMTGVLEITRTESQTETGLKVTKNTNSGNAYEGRLGVTPTGVVWIGNWENGESQNTLLLHPDHTSLGKPLGINSGGTGVTNLTGFITESMLSTAVKNKFVVGKTDGSIATDIRIGTVVNPTQYLQIYTGSSLGGYTFFVDHQGIGLYDNNQNKTIYRVAWTTISTS